MIAAISATSGCSPVIHRSIEFAVLIEKMRKLSPMVIM